MEKKCSFCGKIFDAKRSDSSYCCRSCRDKDQRIKKRLNNNLNIKICNKCQKEFEVKKFAYSRRYCYDCVPYIPKSGAENRQIIKKWALEYKGDACEICGYNKCSEALDFHHIDPNEKDFSLSDRNLILDWQEIKKELDKCQLVCSNCHREIHAKEHNKGE